MAMRQIFNPADPVQIRDMNEMFRELENKTTYIQQDGICILPTKLMIQWGMIGITPSGVDVGTRGDVTFQKAFQSASSYKMLVMPRTSAAGKIFATATGFTAAGAQIWLRHTYGVSLVNVNWIAIGV